MLNERWIHINAESIHGDPDGEYAGHNIGFDSLEYGSVRARLFNDSGMIVDEMVRHDFNAAWEDAKTEWPGAQWLNREDSE